MIFMTGGTGFLGSHLLNALIDSGETVHCLRRNSSNYYRVSSLIDKVSWVGLETCNFDYYFQSHQFDYVLHCATNYGRNQNDPVEIAKANLILPLQLLHAATKHGVKAFINTDTVLDKGINSYSLSKNQFTEWLRRLSTNIIALNVVLEHFYGPNDDPSKFVTFILRSLLNQDKNIDFTSGRQKRDFIYIDDVVSAFLVLLDNLGNFSNGYHYFEVGTGQAIEIRDFVLLVNKIIGNKTTHLNFGAIPYRANEVMNSTADIRKLSSLGWKPDFSLENGLRKTIQIEQS